MKLRRSLDAFYEFLDRPFFTPLLRRGEIRP